jgi:chromosome segregation ATPase
MKKFRASVGAVVALALCGFAMVPSEAQTARSGGGANAQLLQQLQQLASDRTAMEAENARLKKELETAKKERDTLKDGQQVVERRAKDAATALAQSSAQRQTTEQELTQLKAKTQELIAKFRETVQSLRDLETQNTANKQSVATREHELQTCIDRNLALYQLNTEVLTRLEKQGVFTRIAEAEPFTRIKRIQLENLIDDYKARAQDQRASPPTSNPAAPPQNPRSGAAPAPPPTAPTPVH